MAWRIDEVNFIFVLITRIGPANGAILSGDGNTAFTLEVARVHDEPVLTACELVEVFGTEHARLIKEAVG